MPKKGENIYKRKDGRWEGRYVKSRNSSGKIIYGYVYAKTYRDVKLKLQEMISCSNQLPISSVKSAKNTTSFAEISAEWFSAIKPHIKESTQNKYRNLLNSYILPEYGNMKLEQISYDFISKHCNDLLMIGGKKKSGLSAKTVADVLSVVRNILKFAIRKGQKVPYDGSTIRLKCVSKPMRIFSKMEQEKLCRYLCSEYNPHNIGILICLFTGVRIGEVCALHWEDVSFSSKTLHVHSTLQRIQSHANPAEKTKIIITEPKSPCSIRTIPIPETLLSILISYKNISEGYLLTNSNTKFIEPRFLQSKFNLVLKKLEIDHANFHALRHTFATRCIELGFDVKSLSEILGHATVNITMNRYVHPTLELKKENMQKLDSLLTVK